MTYKKNQKIKCVHVLPLKGNDVAPPLHLNKVYTIFEIVLDKENNQHLDVGIESNFNFVRSFETKEYLPDGNKIHWCHPSRFELV